ncbi:MAG: type VI secretion system tip protein TssI/VgrG, partial [Pseudomonadota bacterium]
MSARLNRTFSFESSVFDADAFSVIGFEGEEAISKPFWFDIELLSADPDIDPEDIIGKPAHLVLASDKLDDPRKIHGVVAEFERGRSAYGEQYFYRALLVPRMWFLSLTRQNQIYQNISVPDIVKEELYGSKEKQSSAYGLSSDDVMGLDALRPKYPSKDYPKREYVVQYSQTDLEFVSWWLEYEGIFYYFDHADQRDVAIFGDDNIHFPAQLDENKVSYNEGGIDTFEEAVSSFTHRRAMTPKSVLLREYNYRFPNTRLQAEAEIDEKGEGFLSDYGDHYKLPEEGSALAKVRAEEYAAGRSVYHGASDCMTFAAAAMLELADHPAEGLNGSYYIKSVRHFASQGGGLVDEETGSGGTYSNEFEAIPAATPFRPAREAKRPKIYGIMNAKIDAAGEGTRAEIDSHGRYKVALPWDISGPEPGKATRWVRMAQPYGGGQQGMHFPLHKGTEVLISFVNGDPDRPVITGVAPNPVTQSVVNAKNHTKNVIQTASGIKIEMEDGAPLAAQAVATFGGADGLQSPKHMSAGAGRLASPSHMSPVTPGPTPNPSPASAASSAPAAAPSPPAPSDSETLEEAGEVSGEADKYLAFTVPNDGASKATYWRAGSMREDDLEQRYLSEGSTGQFSGEEVKLDINVDRGDLQTEGLFEYVEGNTTRVTRGNVEEVATGQHRIVNTNNKQTTTIGPEVLLGVGEKFTGLMAATTEVVGGMKSSFFSGATLTGAMSQDVTFKYGTSYNYGIVDSVDLVGGTKYAWSKEATTLAEEQVFFGVSKNFRPDYPAPGIGFLRTLEHTVGGTLAAPFAAFTAALSAIVLKPTGLSWKSASAVSTTFNAVSLAMWAWLV